MSVLIDYTDGIAISPLGDKVGTVTGSATLDLSTGDVFNYTPTTDTTFVFTNPPSSGMKLFQLNITGGNAGAVYDIANATYDSAAFSTATQETNPRDFTFNNDGTKLYVIGISGSGVDYYNLSTPYDVTSAVYDSIFNNPGFLDTSPVSLSFNADGSKLFFLGKDTNTVYQYTLSTPFDLTTANTTTVGSYNLSAEGASTGKWHLSFNNDYSKMYVLDNSNATIYQYTLSTPGTLTPTFDSKSFAITLQASILGFEFNATGSKLFIVSSNTDSVHQYSLSTPYDISTATHDNVSHTVAEDATPAKVKFHSNGTKMLILGLATDSIYQYSTGAIAPATYGFPSNIKWEAGVAPSTPDLGEIDSFIFYTKDGGLTYHGFKVGDNLS